MADDINIPKDQSGRLTKVHWMTVMKEIRDAQNKGISRRDLEAKLLLPRDSVELEQCVQMLIRRGHIKGLVGIQSHGGVGVLYIDSEQRKDESVRELVSKKDIVPMDRNQVI